jgi:hypothetical protein
MLERLPNELLAPIFALACTDGGNTAGALRLVSRHFQTISAPYRFRTIAVAGVDPVTDLVDLLDRTPPELRIIEHMFVSDKTASELAGYDGRTQSITSSPGYAMHALICHAGPHVRSLTLLAFQDSMCARPLARIPFPQLQTLTLEVLRNGCLAKRLIMPRVHTVTLSMPPKPQSCLFVAGMLQLYFLALQRVNVHGPQACWLLAFDLQAWLSEAGPENVCYDIYPSVPREEQQTRSVGRQVEEFESRVAEQDRPQNNVRFHEPQEIQWPSHYATWRGRWLETVNSFLCE